MSNGKGAKENPFNQQDIDVVKKSMTYLMSKSKRFTIQVILRK
ncbi:hypothetical protein [Staphylococcus capitis]|nr:hypothetical protein [Staphylococcus capitis]